MRSTRTYRLSSTGACYHASCPTRFATPTPGGRHSIGHVRRAPYRPPSSNWCVLHNKNAPPRKCSHTKKNVSEKCCQASQPLPTGERSRSLLLNVMDTDALVTPAWPAAYGQNTISMTAV
jgi:hypothetical protein